MRNGLRSTALEACLLRRLERERREPVARERPARERADEVVAAADDVRVERVRPLDVLLDEVLLVLGDRDVQAAVGDEAAVLDRVGVRLGERDELVVLLEVGEVEAGGEAHGLERELARTLEVVDERAELYRQRPAETPGMHSLRSACGRAPKATKNRLLTYVMCGAR